MSGTSTHILQLKAKIDHYFDFFIFLHIFSVGLLLRQLLLRLSGIFVANMFKNILIYLSEVSFNTF